MNYKKNIIYTKVQKIINKFGTSDPFEIVKYSNIKIKYINNITNLLGMYTVIERNRFIFLNSNLEDYMLKMVLAHELGHDSLHRHLTKKTSFQEYELFDIVSQPEYEANIFAAHLLINDKDVISLLEEGYTDVEIAGILNININLLIFKMNEMNRYGANYNIRTTPKGDFFKKIKP